MEEKTTHGGLTPSGSFYYPLNDAYDFHGSLQYLADWCGLATRSSALRVLKALQDKGLVRRKISGKELSAQGKVATHNHYQAIVPDELCMQLVLPLQYRPHQRQTLRRPSPRRARLTSKAMNNFQSQEF